jgi:Flp pilus assembly protein TadD
MAHRPNEPARTLLSRAMALDRRGREKQAIPIYRRAIRSGLKGAALRDAHVCLGSSLRTAGKARQAIAILRLARKKYPNDIPVKMFLALSLHDAGEHAAALRLLAGISLERGGGLAGFGRVMVRKFRSL